MAIRTNTYPFAFPSLSVLIVTVHKLSLVYSFVLSVYSCSHSSPPTCADIEPLLLAHSITTASIALSLRSHTRSSLPSKSPSSQSSPPTNTTDRSLYHSRQRIFKDPLLQLELNVPYLSLEETVIHKRGHTRHHVSQVLRIVPLQPF